MRKYIDPIVTFFISLWAFLKLYDAGFRIGNYNPKPSDEYERFRFFWKNKMIRDMADINRYRDHYTTTFNGHVEDLSK